MFGIIVGALVGLILAETGQVESYVWILWGAIIGLILEIAARLGCPEVVVAIADLFCTIGECFGGGDS